MRWWQDWKRGFGTPYGGKDVLDEPGEVYEAILTCELEAERIKAEQWQTAK